MVRDMTTAILELTFRRRSYPPEAQEQIKKALEGYCEVSLDPLDFPEAGGTTEIWGVLQVPATWIAGGVLANAAYDMLKSMFSRLAVWWKSYKSSNAHRLGPEFINFSISIGNVTYTFVDEQHYESPDIYFMNDQHLVAIPLALQEVLGQGRHAEFQSQGIVEVEIPMSIVQDSEGQAIFHLDDNWVLSGDDGSCS